MMTNRPTIFIAMPLFEGWEHVAHTLETIQQQTCRDYRALISVDGGDRRSYDACLPFLSDPRFEIVLHQDRLGWSGNMNYLASQFVEDFFCYWQHDDYCKPSYLETLLAHAAAHPEASATYCDMQIFGEKNEILRQPSATGFVLERVLGQISKPSIAAIRCLIRADALRASVPIKLGATWALSLARAGELHRVPKLLYFRRSRQEALTFTMLEEPPSVKWRASLDWSLAVLENIYPLIGEEERAKLFAMIVDLATTDKIRLRLKYRFIEKSYDLKVKFARQFLAESASTYGWRPYVDIADGAHKQALCERMKAKDRLPSGEALLMDAILAPEVLPGDAIIAEGVQPKS
jgi:hypothetical protein